MRVPVTRGFSEEVVGYLNTNSMVIDFFKGENFIENVLGLGYRIEQPENHENVRKVSIKAVALMPKNE